MDTQTQRELTEAELGEVLELAKVGDWVAVVVRVFDTFGVDLTDQDGPKVSPAEYALPVEQWTQIGEALAGAQLEGATSLARAGHLLDWMNYGPSSYDEATNAAAVTS